MEIILRKELILNKIACRLIGIAVFVILTSLGAFVRIPLPFSPVPITLQTFFVLLAGAFLGANPGALTQIIYIGLGLAGLPIFTGAGSGLLYLAGPTSGYLFGFILASLLIGKCLKYTPATLFPVLGVLFLGDLLILFCGLTWLKFIFGYNFTRLLLIGVMPFIPGDLLKALAASFIYLKLRKRLKQIF